MMTGMLRAATIGRNRQRAPRRARERLKKLLMMKKISLEMKLYVLVRKRRMKGH